VKLGLPGHRPDSSGEFIVQGIPKRGGFTDRAFKIYVEVVFTDAQERFHINLIGAEHIVCLKDQTIVEEHLCVGVESLENHLQVLVAQRAVVDQKGRLIFPVLLLNPLHGVFIVSVKGIFNEVVAHQSSMDGGRYVH